MESPHPIRIGKDEFMRQWRVWQLMKAAPVCNIDGHKGKHLVWPSGGDMVYAQKIKNPNCPYASCPNEPFEVDVRYLSSVYTMSINRAKKAYGSRFEA